MYIIHIYIYVYAHTHAHVHQLTVAFLVDATARHENPYSHFAPESSQTQNDGHWMP